MYNINYIMLLLIILFYVYIKFILTLSLNPRIHKLTIPFKNSINSFIDFSLFCDNVCHFTIQWICNLIVLYN